MMKTYIPLIKTKANHIFHDKTHESQLHRGMHSVLTNNDKD